MGTEAARASHRVRDPHAWSVHAARLLTGGAVLLALIFLASGAEMARRIVRHHRASDRPLFMFQRVEARTFRYADRPVEIIDERDPHTGEPRVVVRYGEATLTLTPTIAPGDPQLPGLIRHQDWMQVLRVAEHGRGTLRQAEAAIRAGRVPDRLVLVVRVPPAETIPARPGEVFRKEWSFDLYEFLPAGGFEHQRLKFPRGRRPAEGELVEGTWQFYAALMVMPPLGRPSPRFTGDAVQALGWTLPGAAFSGLALTYAIPAAVAAHRRVRRKQAGSV